MSIHAIAAFVANGKPVGARLYNDESNKFQDMNNRDLVNFMTKRKIVNLKIHKNEVSWSSGVYSRYPMIFIDGHRENVNIATIIGVTEGDTRLFKVINMDGKLATLDNETAIRYGKIHGFSNCKVSNKEGKFFIQAIYGEIPKINSTFNMIQRANGKIEINLPIDGSVTEIEIPQYLTGLPTDQLDYITVSPVSEASKIKKITIPENIWYITYTMLKNLPNLETIVFKCPRTIIEQEAFAGRQSLRFVASKGFYDIKTSAFENCKNLERVYSEGPIHNLGAKAFKGCAKLNMQEVVNAPIVNLEYKDIFKDNAIEKLSLPIGMNLLNIRSLMGLKNLKEVRFLSNSITISYGGSEIPDLNADIYFMEGTKLNSIIRTEEYTDAYERRRHNDIVAEESNNWGFGPNTRVHFMSLADVDEQAARTAAKAKMVGINLENGELILSTPSDAAKILAGRKSEEVRNFVINVINQYIASGGWVYRDIMVPVGKYNIKLRVYNFKPHKCKSMKECEDALYYSSSSVCYIFPTAKRFVCDSLLNQNDRSRYIALPMIRLQNKGKIDHIKYLDDKKLIEITYRNKTIERIELGSYYWG